jgi:predicted transcriptional regulator
MARKREKLEIIRDILLVINKSRLVKPTKLLSSSNLSPQMFKEYVNMLLQKNFINEELIKEKRSFSLTKKGKEFLSEYRVIENLIENFGL